jgi:hypothetical protein
MNAIWIINVNINHDQEILNVLAREERDIQKKSLLVVWESCAYILSLKISTIDWGSALVYSLESSGIEYESEKLNVWIQAVESFEKMFKKFILFWKFWLKALKSKESILLKLTYVLTLTHVFPITYVSMFMLSKFSFTYVFINVKYVKYLTFKFFEIEFQIYL